LGGVVWVLGPIGVTLRRHVHAGCCPLSAATGGTPTDDEEVLLRALAVLHFIRFDRQEALEP